MRVALSMLTLVPRVSGGSETYARGLAAALDVVGVHEYRVLAPRLAPDAGEGLPTTVAAGFPVSDGGLGRAGSLARAVLRPGQLRREVEHADVVHYPFTIPLPSARRPTVVTLHDVQHRDLPHLFSRATRRFRALAYDRAARNATHVVVPSEWVRLRAIETLRLDPERVHAAPHGVDHATFFPDPATEREPFLLYPARPWPHKNHATLFEAFALLRRDRPDLRLVLTGEGHDRASLPAGVDARGSVGLGELADLYRRAAALVFPSLYEGFGMPPLEAMACGCPVAASTAGSLPEVCADVAVLFDPTDPAAIAAGVEEALERAADLAVAGPVHAASFTWETAARAHDAIYAAAVESVAVSGRRAR
jgi:glycosyltransferase involved in cell wall biosynthesis